MLKTKKSKS